MFARLTHVACSPALARVNARRCASAAGGRRAFTLVELMLVMALLIIVMAVSAPTLSGFFHGRVLDSETRRFVSLTRYGQSRAVSEGVPMILWVDVEQKNYGLEIEPGYVEANEDDKAVDYEVDKDLTVQVGQPRVTENRTKTSPTASRQAKTKLPTIRFRPDGFIGETSPETITFLQGERGAMQVIQSPNGLHYEIDTNYQQNAQK